MQGEQVDEAQSFDIREAPLPDPPMAPGNSSAQSSEKTTHIPLPHEVEDTDATGDHHEFICMELHFHMTNEFEHLDTGELPSAVTRTEILEEHRVYDLFQTAFSS